MPPPTMGGAAAVARTVETPLGLRSDPLAEVLGFSDFGAVFACVAASRALRDAIDQLSPILQYELVINRFPILATLSCGSPVDPMRELSPRELWGSQSQLLRSSAWLDFGPRLGLDAYVFSIEVECGSMKGVHVRPIDSVFGASVPKGVRSAHVGTGTIRPAEQGTPISFDVPAGLWPHIEYRQLVEEDPYLIDFRVTIMASRRGTHSRAILYRGWMELEHLERLSMPMGGGGKNYWGHQSEAFGWLKNTNGYEVGGKRKPALDLSWKLVDPQLPEGRSVIEARFKWVCSDHNRIWEPAHDDAPEHAIVMNEWDTRLTLELWCGLRPPELPRDFGPEMNDPEGHPTPHALAVMNGDEELDRRWYVSGVWW